MFSMCSELTPCALIPDSRIPQLMQPWWVIMYSGEFFGQIHQVEKDAIVCDMKKARKGPF